jgi:hypothetical protein
MAFDPTFPANNSLISSAELRDQFEGLNGLIEGNYSFLLGEIGSAVSGSAANVNAISDLPMSVSNPPTQAQVQAIVDKLNDLIAGLQRP